VVAIPPVWGGSVGWEEIVMQKNEQWVVWGLSIPIGGGLKIGCALLGVWYYPMGLFSASVYGGGVVPPNIAWFGQ